MTKEEGIKKILEQYPNIKLKNANFLEEEYFNEYSIETIATKLSQLSNENSNILLSKLSNINYISITKPMIKYIIEKNPDYFMNDIIEVYDDQNIISEYTKLYIKNPFTKEKLKKEQTKNINKNKDQSFYSLDISFYNYLIIIQKLYKEKKLILEDIKEFTNCMSNILLKNIVNDNGNYDENIKLYINDIINHLLLGNITPSSLFSSMNNSNKINNLLLVGNFKIELDELANLPTGIIRAIKYKQIQNTYLEFMNIEGLKNVKDKYNKKELIIIFTKMSLLLNPDNVTNIIRHLPQDDEKIEKLFNAFKDIDVSKVKVENNKIKYNNDFIKLFIGNNLKEPNSLLNLIYEGSTNLSDKIEGIYSYWEVLESRYKNQSLKTKLAFIKEALISSKVSLNKDEYLLEGDIINSYYDNKRHQFLSSTNVIDELRKEYAKIKHNYQKTIPYVKGEVEEYSYETIKANDPNIFMLGSLTDNCFKIGGNADEFLRYCANNINGRVLVIKDKNNNLVATVPMIRNGNFLFCNSIETSKSVDEKFIRKMCNVFQKAALQMLNISNKYETEEEQIELILVGASSTNCKAYTDYKKLNEEEIDSRKLKPLKEEFYLNFTEKNWSKFIFAESPTLNLNNLKSFNPSIRYNDPRNEILEVEAEQIDENIKKQLNAIYFEKYQKVIDFSNIEKVIFNNDWFIIIDKKYNIFTCIVGKDPRSEEELNEYLLLIKEYSSHYDENGHIKEDAKYKFSK